MSKKSRRAMVLSGLTSYFASLLVALLSHKATEKDGQSFLQFAYVRCLFHTSANFEAYERTFNDVPVAARTENATQVNSVLLTCKPNVRQVVGYACE